MVHDKLHSKIKSTGEKKITSMVRKSIQQGQQSSYMNQTQSTILSTMILTTSMDIE